VKSGEFKGFSLAGIFQEVEMSKVEDDITDEEYEEAMGYIVQLNRMLK
jgi:hypothetical protein